MKANACARSGKGSPRLPGAALFLELPSAISALRQRRPGPARLEMSAGRRPDGPCRIGRPISTGASSRPSSTTFYPDSAPSGGGGHHVQDAVGDTPDNDPENSAVKDHAGDHGPARIACFRRPRASLSAPITRVFFFPKFRASQCPHGEPLSLLTHPARPVRRPNVSLLRVEASREAAFSSQPSDWDCIAA